MFNNNRNYRGHGAAIYYLFQKDTCAPVLLTVENCSFTDNSRAESVIYISGCGCRSFVVVNTVFVSNKGVSIYLINQTVHIYGNTSFKYNYDTSIFIADHSKVSFNENSIVIFLKNEATNGGAISVFNNSCISFEGDSTVTFTANNATGNGGAISSVGNCNISFNEDCTVQFTENHADIGGAIHCISHSNVLFEDNSAVTFSENNARYFGGAIFCSYNSSISLNGDSVTTFTNNSAINDGLWSSPKQYGGAICSFYDSNVLFKDNSMTIFTSNTANNGGAMLSASTTFENNSTVRFIENSAFRLGGAIYILDNHHTTFKDTTKVTFTRNTAYATGGAIKLEYYSQLTFKGKSMVVFTRNHATQTFRDGGSFGGAIDAPHILSFEENSLIVFMENSVTARGGAIYSSRGMIVFNDSAEVMFAKNIASYGGAIESYRFKLLFLGSSDVTFAENIATINGGAIANAKNIEFTYNSMVSFTGNSATENGGAIYCSDICTMLFMKNSKVTFLNNIATRNGGALECSENCNISFTTSSLVTFSENKAMWNGGAIYCFGICSILFEQNSNVAFAENYSAGTGGAITSSRTSNLVFTDNSLVMLTGNIATFGGAVFSSEYSNTIFKSKSIAIFINNKASQDGGSIYSIINSNVKFEGCTNVTFKNNKASNSGGGIHCFCNSKIIFEGNSVVLFNDNNAEFGGCVYSAKNSIIFMHESTVLTFINSNATLGGAMYCENSKISFLGHSKTVFSGNKAIQSGGVMYAIYSNFTTNGNVSLSYSNNVAENGGAVFTSQSTFNFEDGFSITFNKNYALRHGGAIYFSNQCTATFKNNSNTIFSHNTAGGYGGAMYSRFMQSKFLLETNFHTYFYNNHARFSGNSFYMTIPKSCNSSCIENGIVDITNGSTKSSKSHKVIATTPSKIKLFHPAMCIDAKTECEVYYIDNIMLGQEIITGACVLDYYNQPTNAVQFTVSGEKNPNYNDSKHDVLISRGNSTFQGVSLFGNEVLPHSSNNYSINISYHVNVLDEHAFSVKLIVEVSSCHPGFKHSKELHRCICYDKIDAVICSGSNSTIKKGYWFGVVNGQPTVSVCPVNYCDFTCCDTTDGFYHLSPLRTNQCRLHRSGSACGNCEEGWTLSFDSTECVSVDKCTTGQTVLVVTLTVLYWIAVVVAVLVMAHFKFSIGYLYAVSYYYGMMDITLNQTSSNSQGLFIVLKIVSNIFNISPAFLGKLCLVNGMSGIDQQVVHYMHTFAIAVILTALKLLATVSGRLSVFIHKVINHAACIILLLSYTSIANASLLLTKTLSFSDIDNIYTYLSPDIEYFHGRHLPYAIVAVLCTIVIVIGLPLLLLLQPFLNHKINFVRIKPLLDQFQELYKYKYHCFAAYYLICRVVLLTILIVVPSKDFPSQHILIVSCTIITGIHLTAQPYKHECLNKLDTFMLLFLMLVTILSGFEDADSGVVINLSFVLIFLPLILFMTMMLLMHKNKIKKMFIQFKTLNSNTEDTHKNTKVSLTDREIGIIIDDKLRQKGTISDISVSEVCEAHK